MHKNHIIHRDLKPANFFLTKSQIVKIGDFGLSKSLFNLVTTDTMIGTHHYMAPEIRIG